MKSVSSLRVGIMGVKCHFYGPKLYNVLGVIDGGVTMELS
jgi:hypothetical protein